MKKFIIAICGVMLAGGAMGEDVPSWLPEPNKTNVSPWWNTGTSFSTNITDFYPDVSEEFADDEKQTRHGTYDDEGAIIIWAARKIYDHGAEFCPVQIQAANKNGKYWVWLDYYWIKNDGVWENCKTVCVKGFTGTTCGTQGVEACSTTNSSSPQGGGVFGRGAIPEFFKNLPKWTSLRPEMTTSTTNSYGETINSTTNSETGDSHRHTMEMDVISYSNTYGTDDEGRKANHVVLGVVGKVAHGIKVAPIKIVGQRSKTGGGIKSWIKSAQSNGGGVLLCYDGYTPNSNGTACECTSGDLSDTDWCSGWTEPTDNSGNYDSYIDTTDPNNPCKKYKCIDSYGFEEGTLTCVSCATTRTQGVNLSGECIKCNNPNEMFTNDGCKKYMRLSTLHLVDGFYNIGKCWMKSDPSEYKNCVLCPSGQTYNDEAKTCR